jgi:hypothetical protein
MFEPNETVEKVHFGTNLQIFKEVFLDPSKEVKHSRFRASTAICLYAFYHQPRFSIPFWCRASG